MNVRCRDTVWLLSVLVGGVGCTEGGVRQGNEWATAEAEQALSGGGEEALSGGDPMGSFHESRRLFDVETFGGNGRTCRTCHTKQTGTLNPKQIQEKLAEDPSDVLFRTDAFDDGVS
jgi:hypothetical protein